MSQERHDDRDAPLTSSAARRSSRRRGPQGAGSGYRTQYSASAAARLSSLQNSAANLPTVEEISAGGMVVRETNDRHQVAIIARYNRGGRLEWVLPKGHPEGTEEHHEAAIREVEEETGISGTVLTTLGSIDYWFTVPSHRVHKTVHHYLMRAIGGELTIENDPDQEAVDVAWVDLDRLTSRLTFLNERRIVEAARQLMHDFFNTSRMTSRRTVITTHRITVARQVRPGERPLPTILRPVRRAPKPSDLIRRPTNDDAAQQSPKQSPKQGTPKPGPPKPGPPKPGPPPHRAPGNSTSPDTSQRSDTSPQTPNDGDNNQANGSTTGHTREDTSAPQQQSVPKPGPHLGRRRQ